MFLLSLLTNKEC